MDEDLQRAHNLDSVPDILGVCQFASRPYLYFRNSGKRFLLDEQAKEGDWSCGGLREMSFPKMSNWWREGDVRLKQTMTMPSV